MVKKKMLATIKELIIAKKLLENSKNLIKIDSMENNLIAIYNLNSALNIILKILGEQQKIKSIKQLKNISLEKQWDILSQKYKQQYGQDLSMKTQIFTLNNIINNFVDHDMLPINTQVKELYQALSVFIDGVVSQILNLKFGELDFYLLIQNTQVQKTIKRANMAIEAEEYAEVLKSTSAAFQIAIEDQRQKINYLSDQGILKPEPFMLDRSINIHIDAKDREFIHLVLGTPTKSLERFKHLVPTAIITEDGESRPEIVISDFVDVEASTKENAVFCLNFVLETVLHWESLDLVSEK